MFARTYTVVFQSTAALSLDSCNEGSSRGHTLSSSSPCGRSGTQQLLMLGHLPPALDANLPGTPHGCDPTTSLQSTNAPTSAKTKTPPSSACRASTCCPCCFTDGAISP